METTTYVVIGWSKDSTGIIRGSPTCFLKLQGLGFAGCKDPGMPKDLFQSFTLSMRAFSI